MGQVVPVWTPFMIDVTASRSKRGRALVLSRDVVLVLCATGFASGKCGQKAKSIHWQSQWHTKHRLRLGARLSESCGADWKSSMMKGKRPPVLVWAIVWDD